MSQVSNPRLQLRTWRFPALVLLLLIVHLLIPYRGWQILLVGLGGAWLISYVWARSLARGLQLTREMRFGWAQVGDQMIERFKLVNDSRFAAPWVEVTDHSTLPDYQASRGVNVSDRNSTRWYVEANCTRRGLFTLGPTSLRTGDPFGLYTVTVDYPATLPLLVLPPVVPLPSIDVMPGGQMGEGRPRANTPERTAAASTVREYVPSDAPRWIHWRTSARRDSLFVRLFNGAPASDLWIVLDMDERVQVGEEQGATDEHAIVLAASLADRQLRSRQAVGLAAQGKELVWVAPREGEGQRWELLHTLALVSRGSRSLADLLHGMRPVFGRHASLVIITPSGDTRWIEALVPIMQVGVVPTVLWLDPVSFGGTGGYELARVLLTDLGVAHYTITRDLLDRPEARPGQEWRWGRPVRGGGLVPPIPRRPTAAWRVLSA